MSPRKILKIVSLSLVILVLLAISVDLILLGAAFFSVENLANQTTRYATIGRYDKQYCKDLDADNTPCKGNSQEKEIDAARLMSIHAFANDQQKSLLINPSATWNQPGYLQVIVCSGRDTDNPADQIANYEVTLPRQGDPAAAAYARCTSKGHDIEDPGGPGDLVVVMVDYNYPLPPPINSFLPFYHLTTERQAIIEKFRVSRVIAVPPQLLLVTATPGGTQISSATQSIPTNNPVQRQLAVIDEQLQQSLVASVAYNAPEVMNQDETAAIQLLINPNPAVSPELLAPEVRGPGKIETATIKITPQMKVELKPQDEDAFIIKPIHDTSIQSLSNTESTKWEWLVTAKKGGVQILVVVIYRLLQVNGQDQWREVESYTANINVSVSLAQQIELWDWKWIIGLLLTPLIIPAVQKIIAVLKDRKPAPKNITGSKQTKEKSTRKK